MTTEDPMMDFSTKLATNLLSRTRQAEPQKVRQLATLIYESIPLNEPLTDATLDAWDQKLLAAWQQFDPDAPFACDET